MSYEKYIQDENRFLLLLEKAMRNTLTEDEDDELYEEYFFEGANNRFHYLSIADEKGFVNAYFYLGNVYEKGEGVEQSWDKAIKYWKKSAENGRRGYYQLGDCYRKGLGVDKDYETAFNYYEKAAAQRESNEPEPDELLLRDVYHVRQSFDFLRSYDIAPEWWDFVANKENVPPELFEKIADIFNFDDPRFRIWNDRAADAGYLSPLCHSFFYAKNLEEKKRLIPIIFSCETQWPVFGEGEADMMTLVAEQIFNRDEYSFSDKLPPFRFFYEHNWDLEIFDLYRQNDKKIEDYIYATGIF